MDFKDLCFTVFVLCSLYLANCKKHEVVLIPYQTGVMKCFVENLTHFNKVECDNRLISSGHFVRISATSTHPHCANIHKYRIDAKDGGYKNGSGGGWCVRHLGTLDQYVQITFTKQFLFRGVVTQGRQASDQRVTQYRVKYSNDCVDFHNVGKVYAGNWEVEPAVTNIFDNPVRGRCIRINPVKYHIWMSMRFDVIGCEI